MTADPQLPEMPRTPPGATVLTVGTDLVHVPDFETQLNQPGTVFAQRAFTARELREARRRAQEKGSSPAQHLAARRSSRPGARRSCNSLTVAEIPSPRLS